MKSISIALPATTILTIGTLIISASLAEKINAQDTGTSVSTVFGDTNESLYQAACAACHGEDGSGRTQTQLAFDVAVPDFTDCRFASREPDPDWYAIMHDGGPVRGFDRMMPAFRELLSEEDAQRILDHIRTLCTDDSWPRGELNVPKALFTEKAFPEDEAISRTNINVEGPSSFTQKFTWEKRFGPRNQLEISLPFTRADVGLSDSKESGAGDVSFAFKHALLHSLEKGYILSVGGELVLPTGDETRGFGKGTAIFEPYVLYAKLLPRDSFLQFQGKLEFPVEDDFEKELVIRSAFGRTWTTSGPFGRAWTPMIEVLAARDFKSGAKVNWDLVPQFQVTLNTRQHIMANFGFRVPVNDSLNRDIEFVFYILWDWFDGSALEGW